MWSIPHTIIEQPRFSIVSRKHFFSQALCWADALFCVCVCVCVCSHSHPNEANTWTIKQAKEKNMFQSCPSTWRSNSMALFNQVQRFTWLNPQLRRSLSGSGSSAPHVKLTCVPARYKSFSWRRSFAVRWSDGTASSGSLSFYSNKLVYPGLWAAS